MTQGGSPAGSDFGKQVGASAGDAFNAVTAIILNPVGGLAPAYTALGPQRALGAGIALSVVFALLSAFAVSTGGGGLSMILGFFLSAETGFVLFLKSFLAFLILPATMIGACFLVGKLLGGREPLGADAFTTGAALTPLGVAMVLGIIFKSSAELISLLMLFSMSYLVLMLFTGITRIGGVKEQLAAPATPIVIAVSLWLCKTILSSMISPSY